MGDVAAWFWAVRELLASERNAREALEQSLYAQLSGERWLREVHENVVNERLNKEHINLENMILQQRDLGLRREGRSAVDDICTRERLAAVQRTVDTLNETMQADREGFARELRTLWEAMASQAAPPATMQSSPLIEVGMAPLGVHQFATLPPKVFGQGENFSDVSTS